MTTSTDPLYAIQQDLIAEYEKNRASMHFTDKAQLATAIAALREALWPRPMVARLGDAFGEGVGGGAGGARWPQTVDVRGAGGGTSGVR